MSESGVVGSPTFKPSRISSEAPEVVQAPEPVYQASIHDNASQALRTELQKDTLAASTSSWRDDDHETELDILDRRGLTYQFPPKAIDEDKWRRRRLIVTAAAVVVAFLVGGGVGGGIGTAVASSKASAQTATATATNANLTSIVDYAGCPLVNNMTYASPVGNKQFLKLCGTEIVALEGQNIDLGQSVEPTFNNCLDACAIKEGCVAVTWFIFSASDPKRNSVCFFKDGLGNATSSIGKGQQLASAILKS